ncbi:MAG: U32 family peptidase, partial [Bacteroidales bacterium]|nr:U32 family peptidase [Bacteroidales bacterium]
AVSGKCYLSLHEYNASANRGSCYQLCRRSYEVTDRETGRSFEVDNKYIMSPKDLSTIAFVDKIIDAGIRVFKIEGRARSAEYVKAVSAAYREAADAVCEEKYTPELILSLEKRVSEVFNRGFWDGYYQGAKLGEWSNVYGNKATKKKRYIGKVTNFFSNLSVAEVLIETGELKPGDEILIEGPSTGVLQHIVTEIRTDLTPVDKAVKGEYCSIPVPAGEKLRRSDKVYLWEDAGNAAKHPKHT